MWTVLNSLGKPMFSGAIHGEVLRFYRGLVADPSVRVMERVRGGAQLDVTEKFRRQIYGF